jgi:hypothetical protein
MATYRERRMNKAEKLREWAAKREQKSAAAFKAVDRICDGIPFGQPILVGHHSERHARRDQARIHSGMDKGVEHYKKAQAFESRADNIEAAAANAIYSDDPDAVEALEARIEKLTAQLERRKYINKEVRKGDGWSSRVTPALTDEERLDLERAARFSGCTGYPKYAITNLSADIGRNRKRLEQLTGTAPTCETCGRGKPWKRTKQCQGCIWRGEATKGLRAGDRLEYRNRMAGSETFTGTLAGLTPRGWALVYADNAHVHNVDLGDTDRTVWAVIG